MALPGSACAESGSAELSRAAGERMTFIGSNREFSSATASAAATVQETAVQTQRGLTHEEATRRLAQFGPNEIQREAQTPAWIAMARQFASPLVLLLVGACVVSTALGEVLDAIAIGSIVLLNGFVGFFQEYRAERTILALRSITAPRSCISRGQIRFAARYRHCSRRHTAVRSG